MRIDHKILLFSDLHMVEADKAIIGLDPYARAAQGIAHALRLHPDATRIVVMGDLTHHGNRTEYARVLELFADCPVPVTFMLGNHDQRDVFLEMFDQEPDASGHVQSAHLFGDVTLLCLDTYEETPEPKHSGRLCEARLGWLDAQFSAAPGRVVIAMHHPPCGVGFPGMDAIALQNDAEFLELVAHHGNVVQILAGHVHRTIAGNIRGVALFMLKSTCHQMPMELDARGTSHSVDEPGAYGILLIGPDSIIAHTEDYALAEAGAPTQDYYSR